MLVLAVGGSRELTVLDTATGLLRLRGGSRNPLSYVFSPRVSFLMELKTLLQRDSTLLQIPCWNARNDCVDKDD